MTNPDPTSQNGRQANGQFGPGNPGRSRGARNRLSQQFITTVFNDFQAHQGEVLDALRKDAASDYLRLVAGLVPKQVDMIATASETMSDKEIAKLYQRARQLVQVETDPHVAVEALERLLLCETTPETAP